jgi:hypothetical protein
MSRGLLTLRELASLAILNRNTHDISTDLMLRVLASLGVQVKLQFKSAA